MPYQVLFWLTVATLISGFVLIQIAEKYEYNCCAPRGVQFLTYFLIAVCGGSATALFTILGMNAIHWFMGLFKIWG